MANARVIERPATLYAEPNGLYVSTLRRPLVMLFSRYQSGQPRWPSSSGTGTGGSHPPPATPLQIPPGRQRTSQMGPVRAAFAGARMRRRRSHARHGRGGRSWYAALRRRGRGRGRGNRSRPQWSRRARGRSQACPAPRAECAPHPIRQPALGAFVRGSSRFDSRLLPYGLASHFNTAGQSPSRLSRLHGSVLAHSHFHIFTAPSAPPAARREPFADRAVWSAGRPGPSRVTTGSPSAVCHSASVPSP